LDVALRSQWRIRRVGNGREWQVADAARRDEVLRENRLPFGHQESVGCDAPASFIMPEPDLLLALLIIALDAPAQLGGVDQISECDAVRQGGKPALGRLLLALRPLDQQPFLGRFAGSLMARCNVNKQPRKPRGQPFIAAFPPFDGAPSGVRQSEGEVLDRDRIGRVRMTFFGARPGRLSGFHTSICG